MTSATMSASTSSSVSRGLFSARCRTCVGLALVSLACLAVLMLGGQGSEPTLGALLNTGTTPPGPIGTI